MLSEIVLGLGTSHSPLLSTPAAEWELRTQVDRKNRALAFRDGTFDFPALVGMRKGENIAAEIEPAVRAARFQRCCVQLDALGEIVAHAEPDVAIIVGDDQEEWFGSALQPAFAIFHGKQLINRALTPAEIEEGNGRGLQYSMKVYAPDCDETYPCPSELAQHMIRQVVRDGFDVTACADQPHDGGRVREFGHAFGFVYRRILKSQQIPVVPVLINTYYPPNQPSARRCYEFGLSLGRALRSWQTNARIAVVASGGLSHFVIDQEFDRRVLGALARRDVAALTGEPEYMFRSGTSETKNWIAVGGIMAETGLMMELLDYVPCFRSEAGTGCAMAFAAWR